MEFDDIVSMVADRLNTTSSTALDRIGRFVNDRFKRATSSIGLTPARRVVVTEATTSGNSAVTFDDCVRVLAVYDVSASGRRRVLAERTFDEWRNLNTWTPASGQPEIFAISHQGADTVTIALHPTPDSVFTLSADAIGKATTLSGSDVPDFPEDFHDILVHGALADELQHLKRLPESRAAEADFQNRLSDLRMFFATSAYLHIVQNGRSGSGRGAYWPGALAQSWRRL